MSATPECIKTIKSRIRSLFGFGASTKSKKTPEMEDGTSIDPTTAHYGTASGDHCLYAEDKNLGKKKVKLKSVKFGSKQPGNKAKCHTDDGVTSPHGVTSPDLTVQDIEISIELQTPGPYSSCRFEDVELVVEDSVGANGCPGLARRNVTKEDPPKLETISKGREDDTISDGNSDASSHFGLDKREGKVHSTDIRSAMYSGRPPKDTPECQTKKSGKVMSVSNSSRIRHVATSNFDMIGDRNTQASGNIEHLEMTSCGLKKQSTKHRGQVLSTDGDNVMTEKLDRIVAPQTSVAKSVYHTDGDGSANCPIVLNATMKEEDKSNKQKCILPWGRLPRNSTEGVFVFTGTVPCELRQSVQDDLPDRSPKIVVPQSPTWADVASQCDIDIFPCTCVIAQNGKKVLCPLCVDPKILKTDKILVARNRAIYSTPYQTEVRTKQTTAATTGPPSRVRSAESQTVPSSGSVRRSKNGAYYNIIKGAPEEGEVYIKEKIEVSQAFPKSSQAVINKREIVAQSNRGVLQAAFYNDQPKISTPNHGQNNQKAPLPKLGTNDTEILTPKLSKSADKLHSNKIEKIRSMLKQLNSSSTKTAPNMSDLYELADELRGVPVPDGISDLLLAVSAQDLDRIDGITRENKRLEEIQSSHVSDSKRFEKVEICDLPENKRLQKVESSHLPENKRLKKVESSHLPENKRFQKVESSHLPETKRLQKVESSQVPDNKRRERTPSKIPRPIQNRDRQVPKDGRNDDQATRLPSRVRRKSSPKAESPSESPKLNFNPSMKRSRSLEELSFTPRRPSDNAHEYPRKPLANEKVNCEYENPFEIAGCIRADDHISPGKKAGRGHIPEIRVKQKRRGEPNKHLLNHQRHDSESGDNTNSFSLNQSSGDFGSGLDASEDHPESETTTDLEQSQTEAAEEVTTEESDPTIDEEVLAPVIPDIRHCQKIPLEVIYGKKGEGEQEDGKLYGGTPKKKKHKRDRANRGRPPQLLGIQFDI